MSSTDLRNHLLATGSSFVRGLITPTMGRLGDHLRTWQKPFVTVTNAEVRNAFNNEIYEAEQVHVQIDSVVWAHEFVALSGDEHQRRLYRGEDEVPVRLLISTPAGLSIDGFQSLASLAQTSRFFVLTIAQAVGASEAAAAHAEVLSSLPYILVNRSAPAVIVPGAPGSPE